jgi:hypothetical protein
MPSAQVAPTPPIIDHFAAAHAFWFYFIGGCLFALSGYGIKRLAPDRPFTWVSSWIFACVFFAFALGTGIVILIALVVGGVMWLARHYERS